MAYRDRKQPFPWYGSSHAKYDLVMNNLPYEDVFVEPFGGSGIVILNRSASPVDVYNDIDERIPTFFKALRDSPNDLKRQLENTPYHESEYEKAIQNVGDESKSLVERARSWFVVVTMAYNSVPGGSFAYSTTESRRGKSQHVSRYQTKIEQLDNIVDRLRDIQFLNKDAFDLIEKFDSEDTVMYLDPPYPHETRGTNDSYDHELGRNQHRKLLEICKSCSGKIAISTYQSDLYDENLKDWGRIDGEKRKTSASNKEQERVESLYVNYEVPQGGFTPPNQSGLTEFGEEE